MSRETDLAWAAGIFEGEGNMYVPPLNQGRGLRLTVAQSSENDEPPPILVRFQSIVGCGILTRTGPNALSKKPRWIWRVQRRELAEAVLEALAPYRT